MLDGVDSVKSRHCLGAPFEIIAVWPAMDEGTGPKESKDIATSWSHYLRRQSKKPASCPECGDEVPNGTDFGIFNKHITTVHSRALEDKATDEEKISWIKSLHKSSLQQQAGDRCGCLCLFFFSNM